MMDILEDNGTADRAAEIAASWIAKTWFRRTVMEKGNGGEDMLDLAAAAREHITPEQWKTLEGV